MSEQTAPQPQIKITWLIGTVAALAIFVVIGAYSARMTWTYTDYDQDRAAQRLVTLKKVQSDENALLYPAVDAQGRPHAEWVDQAKGTIRLPIDEAMVKELETLKAQPAQAGCEIPVVAPAVPAPSTGGTNAAPVIFGGGGTMNPAGFYTTNYAKPSTIDGKVPSNPSKVAAPAPPPAKSNK